MYTIIEVLKLLIISTGIGFLIWGIIFSIEGNARDNHREMLYGLKLCVIGTGTIAIGITTISFLCWLFR